MTFARIVFIGAGIWGLVVLAPLFYLVDVSGRQYPAPQDYPHFFYGFLSVAMAWQVAFLVIGLDPVRYRLLMIPAMLEKLGYVVGTLALYRVGRVAPLDAQSAVPDAMLALLFAAAFVRTSARSQR
jgi:hypothetical protein